MQSWWKRIAKALSRAAVPVDGDPGAWRSSPDGMRSGRNYRPGRLVASVKSSRRIARGDTPGRPTYQDSTIERSVWRDVHLPPPAA